MAKFPKEIFMKWEDGGSGPKYLQPYLDPKEAAVMGEKVSVAIYRLYEIHEIEGVINTKKISKSR